MTPEAKKLHDKFKYYWRDYTPSDIIPVCKGLIELMKIKRIGNDFQTVVKRWSDVCNFLKQWEGK